MYIVGEGRAEIGSTNICTGPSCRVRNYAFVDQEFATSFFMDM